MIGAAAVVAMALIDVDSLATEAPDLQRMLDFEVPPSMWRLFGII
jgi:hypothetical protein